MKCTPAERGELASLTDIFRGRIVDVGADSVIVEVTGDVDKVDNLVELLRPRGIVEMVRTGKIALVRGSVTTRRNGAGPDPRADGLKQIASRDAGHRERIGPKTHGT